MSKLDINNDIRGKKTIYQLYSKFYLYILFFKTPKIQKFLNKKKKNKERIKTLQQKISLL